MGVSASSESGPGEVSLTERPVGGTPETAGPIFVGGSGRSGTTVLGKLIGQHRRFARVTTEVRFHALPGGYPELLQGMVTTNQFCERLRDYWFERPGYDGRTRGLCRLGLTREQLEHLIEQFQKQFPSDPHRAAEHLLRGILDPYAAKRDRPSWVETTPRNVRAADVLARVFPSSRIIHIVRDGRDVAASVVRLGWGPSDLDSALRWWADRLAEAHAACRHVGSDRLLTLHLEDLAVHDRDGQFERLVDFLGSDGAHRMRDYFDREMPPERSNAGRWRVDMDTKTAARLDAQYTDQVAELMETGVTCLPRSAREPVD